jgi:hypothetical protein
MARRERDILERAVRVVAEQQTKADELVPESATKDLVMADWQAEWNMARILAAARRTDGPVMVAGDNLPKYLRRQQHEVPLRSEEVSA